MIDGSFLGVRSARHSSDRGGVNRRSLVVGLGAAGALAALGGVGYRYLTDEPEPRLFGVSVEGAAPEALDQLNSIEATLSRALNVVNIYIAWGWRRPFPTAAAAAIAALGAVPEITWEPWLPTEDQRTQPAYSLTRLDQHDLYVDEFARACARYAKPLYLRFAHEMNSDWYPWSVTGNGNDPESYVLAYRRLHSRFQNAGAANVRWVWCPNVIYMSRPDLIDASYPGDDVVDRVALDGYNRGNQSPSDLFGPSIRLLRHIAPDKPLWINEVGTIAGDDEGEWIAAFFEYMSDNDVQCVVWFEVNKTTAPDWRLLRTAETAQAARRALEGW